MRVPTNSRAEPKKLCLGGEIHLKAGSRIVLEAGAGITFLGAGGFIDVTSAGIVIQGNMVWINSGMSHGAAAPGRSKRRKLRACATSE